MSYFNVPTSTIPQSSINVSLNIQTPTCNEMATPKAQLFPGTPLLAGEDDGEGEGEEDTGEAPGSPPDADEDSDEEEENGDRGRGITRRIGCRDSLC